MLDIYSPSGKEEELTGFLRNYLQASGLPVTLQQVDDSRANLLIGQVASGNPIQIGFLGHIDTVPAFDIEHYEYCERDGLIYGLSAADMKSGCAAMIEAFIALQEGGMEAPGMLALVVGEEDTGDGTRRLIEDYAFDSMIVGEPTGMIPCPYHYGYLEMTLESFGTRRHASMANHEHNAIVAMLQAVSRIQDSIQDKHKDIIFNIRDLHSSESGFAVPDRCTAQLDFHMPPDSHPRDLAQALEKTASEVSDLVNHGRLECRFTTADNGYTLPVHAKVLQAAASAMQSAGLEWSTDAFRSHSDANQLFLSGTAPLILGPGQLARAHTRDEAILFDQVIQAARVYVSILKHFHQSPQPAPGCP